MEYHKILTLEPLKGTFLIDGILIEKTEIFEDIPEYEGSYQVSTFGRVKSLSRKAWSGHNNCYGILKDRMLKVSISNGGYFKVTLYINNKKKLFKVASLVAVTFLDHKPDGTNRITIDHKNNIRTHNWLWNLQLISIRENSSKDKKGTSKYTGVSWSKRSMKWVSHIKINGKSKHLGLFNNEKEASDAYQEALKAIK